MLSIIGSILLLVLKIIGILLLVIIGLILLLLMIVLFVPFRYKAEGSYYDDINVKVKFSCLFWIIRGTFIQEGTESDVGVKVLFFKVFPKKIKSNSSDESDMNGQKSENFKSEDMKSEDVKSEEVKSDEIKSEDVKSEKDKPNITLPTKKNAEIEKSIEFLESDKNNEPKVKEETVEDLTATTNGNKEDLEVEEEPIVEDEPTVNDRQQQNINDKKKKTGNNEKKKKKKKKKTEGSSGLDQVKDIWATIKAPENEGVLKHVTKYLLKTLKWILPREIYIDLEVGLEDPALTGYIAGVASVVYLMTKKHIHVIPNFNESVIKGEFKVRGKLYLYQPIYYIIRIIIDKRVRRLIKKARA